MKKRTFLLIGGLFAYMQNIYAQQENGGVLKDDATREAIMWIVGTILIILIAGWIINRLLNMKKLNLPTISIELSSKTDNTGYKPPPVKADVKPDPIDLQAEQRKYDEWEKELKSEDITLEQAYEIYNKTPSGNRVATVAKDVINSLVSKAAADPTLTLDQLQDVLDNYSLADQPSTKQLKQRIAELELQELRTSLENPNLTLEEVYEMYGNTDEGNDHEKLVMEKVEQLLHKAMNDPASTGDSLEEIRENYDADQESAVFKLLPAKILELNRKEEELIIDELKVEHITEKRIREIINEYNEDTIEYQYAIIRLNDFYLLELQLIEKQLYCHEVQLIEGERQKIKRRLDEIRNSSTDSSSSEWKAQELIDREEEENLYQLSKELMDPNTSTNRLIDIYNSNELNDYWDAYANELIEKRYYARMREIEDLFMKGTITDTLLEEVREVSSDADSGGMGELLANRLLQYYDN